MNSLSLEANGTLEASRPTTDDAEMSNCRLLRAYVTEWKYESVRMLRVPAFGIPFLLLPVLLYVLFAVVLFGNAIRNDAKAALNLFVGFAVMGAMGPGLFGVGASVAMEREHGLLSLKRALPTPPGAYLLAKMLMALLFVSVVMLTMLLAAPLSAVRLNAGQFLSLSAVVIGGSLPFCAIGLWVGTRVSGKAAPGIVNLFYMVMVYFSNLFIPLPPSMQWIAQVSPAYYLNQLALRAVGVPNQGVIWLHVALLTTLTLLLTVISICRLARFG